MIRSPRAPRSRARRPHPVLRATTRKARRPRMASPSTAANPSLPFGTKLRVTNVSTGQSVTVRVNDRGPYVPGRVVDVSYSAAEALGMVRGGVAKVKLDVVQ